MSKHQFYYSTKCRYCQAFLEELSRTPYVPEFQLICVDPRPGRPPLPSWLKSVPSMLTAGSSKPLVGPGPVNNWLFERRLGGNAAQKSAQQALEERNAPLAMPTYNPDVAPRPNAAPRGGGNAMSAPQGAAGPSAAGGGQDTSGILAYHSAEMGAGKWSDNYSMLDNAFDSKDGYNPILRNFESLVAGPAAAQSPANRAGGAGGHKPSAKEQQLLSDFERYTAARDRDIPTGPQRR